MTRPTQIERLKIARDKAIERVATAPKGERLRREGEVRALTTMALKVGARKRGAR